MKIFSWVRDKFSRTKSLEISETDEIRIIFPEEPNWKKVSTESLLELVKEYDLEPSCAGLALSELQVRKHPQVGELCFWLIREEAADKWLKSSALSTLLTVSFRKTINEALEYVDDCDEEMLQELIIALNYEFQGPQKSFVVKHPIITRIIHRLNSTENNIEFTDIFFRYFGK